ncbi:GNAT family N-acetyltransferase [Taklimakanibacter lacteus]|uniref:GNAT family N-acetyltransferase n=1 Tax=Taklimakanibacter lacteus TaxID=2268456 RepID=UPI000E674A5E
MTIVTILPAVETPSLLMREIEARDWKAFSHFMTQANYQRHIAMRLRNEEDVKNFVTRQVARQGDERRHIFHLAAEGKERSFAVGDGFIILGRGGLAEVGWGVAPDLWGRGFGTEIGRALVGLAFERVGAVRVWCKVMASNAASLRLARRIGLKHERSHPDYPAGQGRFEAVEFFAMTSEDYFDGAY